jgi:hypothetical protein
MAKTRQSGSQRRGAAWRLARRAGTIRLETDLLLRQGLPGVVDVTRRKLPWGRIIAGIVAAAVLVAGISALVSCVELGRDVTAASVAEPIHLEVDLSKPADYAGDFRQTFDQSHVELLYVQTDPPLSFDRGEAILKGLRGRLVITTPQGKPVLERDIDERSFRLVQVSHEPERFLPGLAFTPFPTGEYRLKLSVEQGAPSLASIPHALVARYGLCGTESIPVFLTGFTAIGCLLVAVLLIVGILWITVRKARAASRPAT